MTPELLASCETAAAIGNTARSPYNTRAKPNASSPFAGSCR